MAMLKQMATTQVARKSIFSIVCALMMLVPVTEVSAQTVITLANLDSAGEGFNSNSAKLLNQTGNTGTTLGQQRLKAFQAAADYWEDNIVSSRIIRVGINMDPQTCDAGSAVLGSAGPESVFRDFAAAPFASTWYVGAVANSLTNTDLAGGQNDIGATFNSDIDNNNNCLININWWYGINSPAPAGSISFFDTVLHEIGHGLGVLSLVSEAGVRFLDFNDAYMRQLYDEQSDTFWRNMNNAQRAASIINTPDLVWLGANADANSSHLVAGKTNGHIRMYAPNPFEGGSSVSHWDDSLTPDELMEPFATTTSNDLSTIQLLKDVGWQIVEGPGEIGFSTSSSNVFEDKGPAGIKVSRTLGKTGAVSVNVSTSNISAMGGGVDYDTINQTLNWADGELGTKTVNVNVVDDEELEPGGETVQLSLSGVSGGASLGISSATLGIFDPDTEDFLLLTVPAIAASSNSAPPPPQVVNPEWLVANEVCCPGSSAKFSVTQGSDTRSSTAPNCSTSAPISSAVLSTPGNKNFTFKLSSSACGDIPGSFNFSMLEKTRYFIVAQFDGGVTVNIFSQPIGNLITPPQSSGTSAESDMKFVKTIKLSNLNEGSGEGNEQRYRQIDVQ